MYYIILYVCMYKYNMHVDQQKHTLLFCASQHLYTTLLLSLTPVVCWVVLYEHSSYLMCPHVYSLSVSLYTNRTLFPTPISNFKPHPT